jgi:hypothetical protein
MAILQRTSGPRSSEERLRPAEWRTPAAAEASEEFDDAPEPRVLHRVGSTTMVVALMVVVAIVGLYSMRNLGTLSAATMLPREVEALVSSVLAPKADPQRSGEGAADGLDDRGVFGLLDADLRLRLQVPLASLDRNPFEPWRDPAAVTPRAVPVAAAPRNGEAEAWDREMDRIGGLLQLKSTLGGGSDRAMANINGRLIRLGDVFAVETADAEFRVERIDLDEVALRARNARLGTSREIVIRVHRGF